MDKSKLANRTLAWGALALAMAAAAPAGAAVYDFSISTSQDSASGQFTVTDGTSPFTVTGVTGTVDGSAITGLSGYGGADQLLYDTAPYADRAGIAFSAGGLDFNIFRNYFDSNGNPVYSFCNSAFNGGCTGGSADAAPVAEFTVSLASSVPEPASWAMMIGGVGIAGGALRRRARVTRVAFG